MSREEGFENDDESAKNGESQADGFVFVDFFFEKPNSAKDGEDGADRENERSFEGTSVVDADKYESEIERDADKIK